MIEKNIIKWRKIGGGTFRMRTGKIIKPNQVFSAAIEDIPTSFRDLIEPLDPSYTKAEKQTIISDGTKFEIRPAAAGWYDIFNIAENKRINEKSLRKKEAEGLLNILMD